MRRKGLIALEPEDLKAWRARNELTQQAAADSLGISRRTYVAYEQGESAIPIVVEYACNWLDKNPAAIQPRDRFRITLTDGGTAGTREVALAGMALIQGTLARLEAAGVLSSEMLLEICNTAIAQHSAGLVKRCANRRTGDRQNTRRKASRAKDGVPIQKLRKGSARRINAGATVMRRRCLIMWTVRRLWS